MIWVMWTRDGGRTRKGDSTRRRSVMELGVVAMARVVGEERGFELLTGNGGRTRKGTTRSRSLMVGVMITATRASDRGGLKL
jgi:hypothetical protein